MRRFLFTRILCKLNLVTVETLLYGLVRTLPMGHTCSRKVLIALRFTLGENEFSLKCPRTALWMEQRRLVRAI